MANHHILPSSSWYLHFGSALTINCMSPCSEEMHSMGKKEVEDMEYFHAWEHPFAAGVGSNAASPVQEKTLPVSAPGYSFDEVEGVLWPNYEWAHRAQMPDSDPGQHDFLVFFPDTALTGGVRKPSKHLKFHQPGPVLAGLGFLKPCVSDTVSINQSGIRNTDYGVICEWDLHVERGELGALPPQSPCSRCTCCSCPSQGTRGQPCFSFWL